MDCEHEWKMEAGEGIRQCIKCGFFECLISGKWVPDNLANDPVSEEIDDFTRGTRVVLGQPFQ